MDNKRCVYVFDIEEEMTGKLWKIISSVVDPEDLFYAVWVNSYHNETFFLDTVFENIIDIEPDLVNECLCNWIDAYYDKWGATIDQMRSYRNFNLNTCRVDLGAKTLYVLFKRRDENETFYPRCL